MLWLPWIFAAIHPAELDMGKKMVSTPMLPIDTIAESEPRVLDNGVRY